MKSRFVDLSEPWGPLCQSCKNKGRRAQNHALLEKKRTRSPSASSSLDTAAPTKAVKHLSSVSGSPSGESAVVTKSRSSGIRLHAGNPQHITVPISLNSRQHLSNEERLCCSFLLQRDKNQSTMKSYCFMVKVGKGGNRFLFAGGKFLIPLQHFM